MTWESISSIATALVVGGGIGGMATAISLAERGVRVDLIDLDPDWRVYGAGITITWPAGRDQAGRRDHQQDAAVPL
jgi:2-polyprenyl-6-methoxyphenol hydroxylase-like FAD-dependent oxidoreductase